MACTIGQQTTKQRKRKKRKEKEIKQKLGKRSASSTSEDPIKRVYLHWDPKKNEEVRRKEGRKEGRRRTGEWRMARGKNLSFGWLRWFFSVGASVGMQSPTSPHDPYWISVVVLRKELILFCSVFCFLFSVFFSLHKQNLRFKGKSCLKGRKVIVVPVITIRIEGKNVLECSIEGKSDSELETTWAGGLLGCVFSGDL